MESQTACCSLLLQGSGPFKAYYFHVGIQTETIREHFYEPAKFTSLPAVVVSLAVQTVLLTVNMLNLELLLFKSSVSYNPVQWMRRSTLNVFVFMFAYQSPGKNP